MSVTVHTSVGDIKMELFCEQCPKVPSGWWWLFGAACKIFCEITCILINLKYISSDLWKFPGLVWNRLLQQLHVHTKHQGELERELMQRQDFAILTFLLFPGLYGTDWRPNKYWKRGREHLGREISGAPLFCRSPVMWHKSWHQDEIKDDLKHKTRGVLSMANSGPNTNGSQWFLTYAPQPSLDLKWATYSWNSWSYLLLFKVHSVWEGDRRLGHFGRTWTDSCESKEPPASEGGGGNHQCSHHPCKSHGWLICQRHSFCSKISLFNFVHFRQDGFPVQGQGLREADDKAEQGLGELGGLHGSRGEWWQWFWGLWKAMIGK